MCIIANHVHYIMKIKQAFPCMLKNMGRPAYEANIHLLVILHENAFQASNCIIRMQTAMNDCVGEKWSLVQCKNICND